jgi:hypothetical protein
MPFRVFLAILRFSRRATARRRLRPGLRQAARKRWNLRTERTPNPWPAPNKPYPPTGEPTMLSNRDSSTVNKGGRITSSASSGVVSDRRVVTSRSDPAIRRINTLP